MADNVFYTDPGSGTTLATDDVAGVHYQKCKLVDGTADSTTAIASGNGTATNALRVTLASDTTGVVGLAAGTNAVGKLAANDGVDIGDVTINNASLAVTGTFWQATQPVSGTVTANLAAGTNNIGDVDVLTVNGVAPAFGSGVRGSTVQRVTIATDDRVPVTDGTTRLGVYYYHSGALVVNAAADGAATAGGGRLWLQNPTGSGVTLRVRKIRFKSQLASALVAVTSPRIAVEKGVFTGTASGASVTAAKRKTADASAVGSLRTAVTGMTISSSAVVCSFFPVSSATAVAYNTPAIDEFDPGAEDYIELAAGELLVVRQADAGTASDTRRFMVDFVVEEF